MSFKQKIETADGILGIWEFTESLETLISLFSFSEKEQIEFNNLKFAKRKTEYLSTRLLLQNLLNEKAEIIYSKSGKPAIKNNPLNLSISHSADLVVVIVSNKNVGIDAEQLHRNIDKVTKRFLSSIEINQVENCENPQTAKIVYWGAKESIFKCTGFNGVQFDTQISISPFQIKKEGTFYGTLTSGTIIETYRLQYLFYKNNSIVFCVEEKNDKE